MLGRKIGERVFTMADQRAFARLSGDANPVHIDELAARRTLFGACVVHGVHVVVWALDRYTSDRPAKAVRVLRVEFPNNVPLENRVSAYVTRETDEEVTLVVRREATVVANIRISWSEGFSSEIALSAPSDCSCRALSFEQAAHATGRMFLFLDDALLVTMFPSLAARVEKWQLAEILATTRLVGMECPGLHSIFAGMQLTFEKPGTDSPQLDYHVLQAEQRYSIIKLAVNAPGMSGVIHTFFRPPQCEQPSLQNLRERVAGDEFQQQTALIVGGSRGAGEVTAKLIAAGGGRVLLTYYKGAAEAGKLREEIIANGGQCEIAQFDVTNGSSFPADWRPTHLYYFATPFISSEDAPGFRPSRFEEYCRYYIRGFSRIITMLRDSGVNDLAVLYPSTVFLDEPGTKFAEYRAAKAAGETLCAHLDRAMRGCRFFSPRLPQMLTDQTASLMAVPAKDPGEVMLRILRDMSREYSSN
jgi:MaoC like domain